LHYNNDIYHLITYGTPHNGTPLAQSDFDLQLLELIDDFTLLGSDPNPCADFEPSQLATSPGIKQMRPNSTFLNEINTGSFPPGVLHTSLIATADDLDLGGFRLLCGFDFEGGFGTDCVVSRNSQNLWETLAVEYHRNPLPVQVLIREVTNRTHSPFVTGPPFGNSPGEPQDITGILWAVAR
jgi:hypothetical protein